jgi:hypothetical protein
MRAQADYKLDLLCVRFYRRCGFGLSQYLPCDRENTPQFSGSEISRNCRLRGDRCTAKIVDAVRYILAHIDFPVWVRDLVDDLHGCPRRTDRPRASSRDRNIVGLMALPISLPIVTPRLILPDVKGIIPLERQRNTPRQIRNRITLHA